MNALIQHRSSGSTPVLVRFAELAAMDGEGIAALKVAQAQAVMLRARTELTTEGRPIPMPRLIVSGWAARVRILADGRRQFLSFLLPGDLIGMCRQPNPIAVSTVVALTELSVCTPPAPDRSPALANAYAISMALEEGYLLAQITRLGRFHAQERITDLLLELNERLTMNGMAYNGRFEVPLTQEMLGDALGLTSVHVNRMLQAARQQGDLTWRDRQVVLPDPEALARKLNRLAVRVSLRND